MNPASVIIVCVSFLLSGTSAILPQVAIPLATTTALAGATGGGTATLLAVAGAAKLIGAGILATSLGSGLSRGRRSAEINVDEQPIRVIEELEPQQCMRKLICDLAATNQESNPIFVALGRSAEKLTFEEDALTAGFEFRAAARVGQYLKDIERCQLRYSCPFSNEQLLQIAAV
eukprot:TRINITY_DN6823_c0_g1_i1.p1 TRINITY_DN6823_c0_g1~~TRINITY_DN6823_c0_g1_i1.p1  ORF type:complete len:174 (+),score=37.91 TRINITY_DN6823_c0_g1_i1:31-552(+)